MTKKKHNAPPSKGPVPSVPLESKVSSSDKVVPEINYMEKFQRLQAEFANYEKRTEKEKVELLGNANAGLISQLLEVLDNFDLALKHNEDAGVAMIHGDLLRVLEKHGLKAIGIEGKFNPKFHEALAQERGEEDGIILGEFQRGYLLNDKLLRASKVKISTSE
jgi:molecular chaperone GrpE